MCSPSDRPELELLDCMEGDFPQQLALDVKQGLTGSPRSIPSCYLYDDRGSRLFERICELPEYYPTRTELVLLRRAAPMLMGCNGGTDVVELGAGSSRKIRVLLQSLEDDRRQSMRYIPLDVCREALVRSARDLSRSFPEVAFTGVVGDFNRHIHAIPDDRPRLFLFLGSTLGNFSESEARTFLETVADAMKPHDSFLLGLDRVKPVDILERAYNDGQGVTAAFNRNVLRVINRELKADFDLARYDHLAFYRPEKTRVEMHLRAAEDMKVRIADLDLVLEFRQGDTIRTEICRKFTWNGMERMVSAAGLVIRNCFTDPDRLFSLLELKTRPRQEGFTEEIHGD